MPTPDIATCTYHQAEVILVEVQRRLMSAPRGSRSEAIWLGRRDRIVAALRERGLTYQRSTDGGYMVGRPSDFRPL